jgi:hypothetical protein
VRFGVEFSEGRGARSRGRSRHRRYLLALA